MKNFFNSKAIIDVTKPPYCVDNTGKIDCTEILCKILDDILIREIDGTQAMYDKMIAESDNLTEDWYVGLEAGKLHNGEYQIVFPEYFPPTRIVYFPKGEYLVSDTVTYTLKNLKNLYYCIPYYEICRNIHFVGESMEETVIRLQDNSKGFEKGNKKPVVSFINNEEPISRDSEVANSAFMNCIEDITIDCGRGNGGAIGLRYINSNIGKIQNVNIKTESGFCGIDYYTVSQGVYSNIKISGFDYGIHIANAFLSIFDTIDVSRNKIAGFYSYNSKLICKNIISKNINTFEFGKGKGHYYFIDDNITYSGDTLGNKVFYEKEHPSLRPRIIPNNTVSDNIEDYAYVDDFGAIGDRKTDSTKAIQKALNSGKPNIIFGEGHYLINGNIKIPKTVKTIDFSFCSFVADIRLIAGEYNGAFVINEDSSDLLVMKNLYAGEQFRGHFRFVKHSAKRDLLLSDIQLMTANFYFNTVEGSKVYINNCFNTCGTYPCHKWISDEEIDTVYSRIFPYEFHGQTVYGRMINAERAETAILNDNSDILIDGFRIEGPGTALKSINNGKTKINIFCAGLGYKTADYNTFDINNSQFKLIFSKHSGFDENTEYNCIINVNNEFQNEKIYWEDLEKESDHCVTIDSFSTK